MWKSLWQSKKDVTENQELPSVSVTDQQPEEPVFRPFPEQSRPTTTSDTTSSFMSAIMMKSSPERAMNQAARRFGDQVQAIVQSAKTGDSHEDWKSELLVLLSGPDITTLLAAAQHMTTLGPSSVAQELPPNLIHCLRLLRVLELQQADTTPKGLQEGQNVTQLLVALTQYPPACEQMRPHLFGLLALPGAVYPNQALFVARQAGRVVTALAQHLTTPMALFLHARQMIQHMTDDVKDLCMPTQDDTDGGLTGADAEAAGCMVIALTAVIQLVVAAHRLDQLELLQDFETADGYTVLSQCINHATGKHGEELLELASQLAVTSQGMVYNDAVINLWEDWLIRSNPLLMTFARDDLPDLEETSLEELAGRAITTAVQQQQDDEPSFQFDMAEALLSTTLQLFSDHTKNYEILEDRLHILTYYLLALPCFESCGVKTFVLKTLEFVLTGLGVGNQVRPVNACIEIFFALCLTLMRDKNETAILESLAQDAHLMGNTLEKLLQFDQRVAPIMVESGILTSNLESLLRLIDNDNKSYKTTTPLDATFSIVCRVLVLLVSHQPVNFSRVVAAEEDVEPKEESTTRTNLHILLDKAIYGLGVEAARQAAGVFESYMSSFASLDGLNSDMKFVLRILHNLANQAKETHQVGIIDRQSVLWSMLRAVLEARSLARESFRNCGGFDQMLACLLAWRDTASTDTATTELSNSLLKLLQASVGVVDAAIGVKSRNPMANDEASTLTLPVQVLVDPISSRMSSRSPASQNRNFIRQQAYYLDLAAAVAGTGLLKTDAAGQVVDIALQHVDPSLVPVDNAADQPGVRNPDAVRLVLGVALFMPDSETGKELATKAIEKVLSLSTADKSATTLRQIASCGLCYSLTNPNEFGPILSNCQHPLHSEFEQLLIRLASHRMSYSDFVGILRCMAGPILSVGSGADGRIRLPAISSSVKKLSAASLMASGSWSEEFQQRESEICSKLSCLCRIAKESDPTARVRLGGDSINTIAVLLHKVRLEDRLKVAAEEGRLKYLEVERIDSSAVAPSQSAEFSQAEPTSAGTEEVWTPIASSGFTYSMWLRHDLDAGSAGNVYILDLSNPSASSSEGQELSSFLSVWYDVQNQRFNVMSYVNNKGEPTCFPVSPLLPNIWHHVLVTYAPAKRSVISRKSVVTIFVDGRPLEAEVKVEAVSLPSNARVVIGAPNPALAVSGIVRGVIPVWEMGPAMMISTVLLDYDAVAVYAYGPRFPGLLWGDRPQRLSLAATATATFGMLANTGEVGSLASALRRRDMLKLERAGYSTLGHTETDDLASLSLTCSIPPECVIFGYQPCSALCRLQNTSRRLSSERLVNLARLSFLNDEVSTDAVVYGRGSVITPLSFADNLQWVGGPEILMPLVNAANSSRSLALTLEMIREGSRCHRPNLEMLQAGGGYRVLGVLLQEKPAVDESCLDQCLAFAIHGFNPGDADILSVNSGSFRWVLSDLDAMKHLLLNHKVWDLRKYGPEVPLRLLSALNRLVHHRSIHKAFNARRLHQVGIVRWTLHLMIEACELFIAGEQLMSQSSNRSPDAKTRKSSKPWFFESPLVSDVSVGGDPGSPFLLECKNLLRRVLTFMLTPGDLEALSEASVHTVTITPSAGKSIIPPKVSENALLDEEGGKDERMLPSSTMRLHLVRLLEELIVDGVNEIIASNPTPGGKQEKNNSPRDTIFQPHSGGVASPGQPYFSTAGRRGMTEDGAEHPKHQQAQAFLSAFSGFLTPVWFATLLEGSREEASASAILRLMILMLQGSSSFEAAFKSSGGFLPFVLSVPRYSTCPGVAIALLSQLLNVPILHLHALPNLDPEQLCELFDAEGDREEAMADDMSADPSGGIFALVAECLGRNMKLIRAENEGPSRAQDVNRAIFELIFHQHDISPPFREYCTTPSLIEPLSQTLCMLCDDKRKQPKFPRSKRRSFLADVPTGLSPTERFIGGPNDPNSGGMGLVRLLRRVIMCSVKEAPLAAKIVKSLFISFPIHATAQQVEAFQLVVLEHCCKVIDKVMEEGGSVAVANCVGICSVMLEQMVNAFLTSEAALEAVKAIANVLDKLVKFETSAVHSLANPEHSFLTMDAAHLACLTAATALRVSLAGVHPRDTFDRGDEDLQSEVLQVLDSNIDSFLLIPSTDRRTSRKVPSGSFPRPAVNTKLYALWLSSSIARCVPPNEVSYPDLSMCDNSDLSAIAPLLVILYRLLLGDREDVRSLAISILIALLRHRPNLMSELLVVEIQKGDQVEKIDVVSRGGFRALLTAHEAASATASGNASLTVQRRYESFFAWFDRHQDQVQLVFDSVEDMARREFPSLQKAFTPQVDAVEEEQKRMLMKLAAEDGDQTIACNLERAELSRRCNERTAEYHSRWRRQGFDDLAYGAMKLKILIRRLKGSFSIWEGGTRGSDNRLALEDRLRSIGSEEKEKPEQQVELVTRWKLDLTEGYERQRRRLIPNYEFHELYNLDQSADVDIAQPLVESDAGRVEENGDVVDVEATAALLKDLNLKRTHKNEEDLDSEFDDDGDEVDTVATTATAVSSSDGASQDAQNGTHHVNSQVDDLSKEDVIQSSHEPNTTEEDEAVPGNEDSYELVTGLLQKGDWPQKSYNVRRCTGLEVTKALFLVCQDAIYVIDGFEQTDGDRINRVEREQSTFYVNLRPKGFKIDEKFNEGLVDAADASRKQSSRTRTSSQADLTSEVIHQHRSQRLAFVELHAVYRRRYQLQQTGLEFYDVHKNATLISFEAHADREEVLSKVLQSKLHPESVFSTYGSIYGTSTSFSKIFVNMKAKIISQWVNGKMTNFDFLMHLNNLAGRSFNDLTQYPVFPWVISDYESDEIDLSDPKVYRDLSKPMGAIGEERAGQFKERYEALESTYFGEDDPPPFHYGTHYSSAAYTLYYLMRLEPFSRLALALQGGRFDVADRLFHDVGRSWKSASTDNLQDVRELIPEFFYLPDFLVNTNGFDFGETQRGKTVHDVTLPKWAKGDPERFIRVNRQALESPYVSANLHHWIDLVFGYKQRSVEDLNVFVHVTYEGEVDLESMTDPVQRASTIAQIQNFGQTPSRLERKSFPQRTAVEVLKDNLIDFGVLPYLATLTPPLLTIGAPHRIQLAVSSTDTCKLGVTGQVDRSVGDLCLFKGHAIGVGRLCTLLVAPKKYCRYGGLNNGLSIHAAAVSTRYREVNKLLSIHDGLHRSPISVGTASLNGDWIVTGSVDSTIRVWRYDGNKLDFCASLCGHDGYQVSCLDISTEFNIIVSGSDRGTVLLWDLRTLTFIRQLQNDPTGGAVRSVSINNKNGNIVTLVGSLLTIFDINGRVVCRRNEFATLPTCAVATDCPEWMENGVVAVTGHLNGDVCLFSLDYCNGELVMSYQLEGNPHTSEITALRVTGSDRQDHLLVGDSSGKITVFKTVQLESLETEELVLVTKELIAQKSQPLEPSSG